MDYDVKDLSLAESGRLRIEWAGKSMPVLNKLRERFNKDKPLKNLRISACLHVTSETANLMATLKSGGANLRLAASNPLSTQDEVAAALVKYEKIPVFAIKGEDNETYYRHLEQALAHQPQLTMDDGADLVTTIHEKDRDLIKNILGGTEETTTGVIRLRSMARAGVLAYPIIAVNDAMTKHLFDNRYGTGQSSIDGILRATNILLAGLTVVICGYGWCGRGVASRAKGAGARVTICEVDHLRALEALMDGYQVKTLREAVVEGDVFITATGNKNVIRLEHFKRMKSGALIANAGHFNVEIDLTALDKIALKRRKIRQYVEEYQLSDGRCLYVLAEGRLINLAAAEGHPAMVMDMSFANQALSVLYLRKNSSKLEKKVYSVPENLDKEIARLKLDSMGIKIDRLTPEQQKYLLEWKEGT
ncbi:MAG TPA: adenosylhomocysteinase [Candidatus Saccharicenans sp.]|mgnify:CR=1 FL=1|jgi:adenosylhomocysteinase|nr:adenosylhomocysteinase [Candidatus Saccharicenans sp.]HRD01148.1 adenosylhomocysteinase [Candidatus Saccharicenans sp.]